MFQKQNPVNEVVLIMKVVVLMIVAKFVVGIVVGKLMFVR